MEGKKKVIGLGILLSVLFLISASYAWLKVSVVSESNQVIHAGKLDLILDDEASDGIHMENVVPISDTKGREEEGYQFKLINRGTISSRYTLYLDDLSLEVGEERMKDSIVKYSLERDGVELSSGLLPEMGTNPNRVLDTGVINGKTTYTYVLKVWMDQDATIENQGTIFYTKIRAEAEQTNIPIKKSEMELTPESQERVPIKEGEDPKKYTYTSSDWNVVKVDEEGNLDPIGPGYAVVTKTDQYGEKEEITVHVTVPVTAEFRTNDKIDSVDSIENNTCNLTENKQTTCQVKVPSVEVVDGYEFIGWSTIPNSYEGEKENIEISLDKKILYPIVKKIGATHQVTIVEGVEGVKSIDGGDLTCKVEDTYNNEEIKTGCKVTLPTITPEDGYTVIGWSTDPNAEEGIASGGEVEISGATTFYPIVKKDTLLITATFKLNGAASLNGQSGDITKSCDIHTNSAGEPLDECEVEVPVITASSATPTVVGFNENKDATIAQILPETRTITINRDITYYAITKSSEKKYTVTFYRNGAKSLGEKTEETKMEECPIPVTYNGEEQVKSCSITSPIIEPSDNTPRVIGYSTEPNPENHTSSWDQNITKQISSDAVYYAQTANNDEITYTASYRKGNNISSLERESDSCSIEPSYNGVKRGTSCTVTAPMITPKAGYTSVGYSEMENDTIGSMSLTLTKDMTFYANAVANSYKIEYYSEGEKVGESGAQVGTAITLTTQEGLGISKRGYNFKGWDTNSTANDIKYNDGAEVSDLSMTEGSVVKLYAVYVDDIRPVCTFSELQDSYTVGDRFNLTITCTDEGSGLVETPSFDGISTNGIVSAYTGSGGTIFIVNILSSSYKFENGKLVLEYELEANSTLEHDNYIVALGPKQIYDLSGNYNEYKESPKTIIYGKTFTATMTQDGVEGVDSIGTTASSCTTKADNRSCDVTLGTDVTVKDGYRWAGWSMDKTAPTGAYEFTLTEDTTFYPVVGPIFEIAYTYNQTTGGANYCVTGEEETCEKTTCYQSDSGCNAGTIFKYAVKSTYPTERRVGSLDDHVYYFHVMHDDGDKLTLQSREDLKNRDGDYSTGDWNYPSETTSAGPTLSIEHLEEITDDWEYVNTIKYTMGTTEFLGNPYNNCWEGSGIPNCNKVAYSWPEKTVKARLITTEEARNVGCTTTKQSCPIWLYNYSSGCSKNGCTKDESINGNYATMSATQYEDQAWMIYGAEGRFARNRIHGLNRGIRAVIELDKSKFNR